MNKKELVELSGIPGRNSDTVPAGDVSIKEGSVIRIRTSANLSPESKEDFRSYDREKLNLAGPENKDPDPFQGIAMLHNLIRHTYVAHLHSPVIDAFMCSRSVRQSVKTYFGDSACFIQYADPGSAMFKKADSDIELYRQEHNSEPSIIFLENNGIIIGAESVQELIKNRDELVLKVANNIELFMPADLPYNPVMDRVLPALRMLLSSVNKQVVRSRHNSLIEKYTQNQQDFHRISIPLTPGTIENCRTRYMFIEQSQGAERIYESFRYQLPNFINEYGYQPAVVVIKGAGIFAFADSHYEAEKRLDAFENHIKICHYALQLGGAKYLTPEQVAFIDSEIFKKVKTTAGNHEKYRNMITAVIGAGKILRGISSGLFASGMNVIIAGNDEPAGESIIKELNASASLNKAVFIKTDPTDAESVKKMVSSVVKEFGGLDLLITQSHIYDEIKAGSTSPEDFSAINEINNKGFFLCVKYASEVMKLQNQADPGYFSDIIRINSVPAGKDNFLNHSDKGLARMFASELSPYRIKVNILCHGYFFDDPLWTDQQKGLFAQYLKSGKITGARNIDDVKKHMESQIPLNRGCSQADITKAVLYLVDQEYETGQVLNVTGGLQQQD